MCVYIMSINHERERGQRQNARKKTFNSGYPLYCPMSKVPYLYEAIFITTIDFTCNAHPNP